MRACLRACAYAGVLQEVPILLSLGAGCSTASCMLLLYMLAALMLGWEPACHRGPSFQRMGCRGLVLPAAIAKKKMPRERVRTHPLEDTAGSSSSPALCLVPPICAPSASPLSPAAAHF